MSTQFFGILPYDSTDSSILLKSSLTTAGSVSSPTVGSAGAVVGTGHTFDSVLGFKAASSGNSGIYFQNLTGYAALDAAGQISFEIEKAIVGSYSPTYASDGTTPSTQWTLTWGDGSAVYGAIRKVGGTPSYFGIRPHSTGDAQAKYYVHTQNKDSYVRVTYSWNNGSVALYVDGKPIYPETATQRVTRWTSQFSIIGIMGYLTAASSPNRDGYVRNIIVSTMPVMMPKHHNARIGLFGHSFVMTYAPETTPTTTNYDSGLNQEFRKLFVNAGYEPTLSNSGVGGGYVDSALSATKIEDYVTTLLANKPTHVVFIGGTNDVGSGSFTQAAFQTELRSRITEIATGTYGDSIQQIVVCTVPSRSGDTGWTATVQDNITAANVEINALPAWFDATYPSRSGDLVIADVFNAWGGMNTDANVQIGQMLGTSTNLHPSPIGNARIARAVFNKVVL